MKIFTKDDKVNFVDDNNVLVGYDVGQVCCENAGYVISTSEKAQDVLELTDLSQNTGIMDEYSFDPLYYREGRLEGEEDGGVVCFKLVAPKRIPVYLYLYNFHNGYYGHGFTAEIGGLNWESGSL